MWMRAEESGELPQLIISGGAVSICAEGDGLDSNGDLLVEGGTVLVDRPSSDANGAIDSGTENGGVCTVSGGTVLAIGSSGMAKTFDESSGQCSFRYNLETALEAGSEITVTDAQGTVLIRHTAAKSASSAVFSCPELTLGETYRLTAGGQEAEITLDGVSVQAGSQSGGNFRGGSGPERGGGTEGMTEGFHGGIEGEWKERPGSENSGEREGQPEIPEEPGERSESSGEREGQPEAPKEP